MKFYKVVWEQDGERQATYAIHALNGTAAISHAEAFYESCPKYDFPNRKTMTVRALRLKQVDGKFCESPEDASDA